MTEQSKRQLENQPKSSVQTKLVCMLMVTAIAPICFLAATTITGLYQFECIMASIVAQVIGLALGYHFGSGIVRQSTSINAALTKINSGDFEARAETITTDELGCAAVALNSMCDSTLNLIQSNDERDEVQASIERLKLEMTAIAAGDLTITTKVNDDMTGPIANSVNHMTEQLRSIVQQVQSAAEQVTTSASRFRDSSTAISNDSDNQAVRIGDASEQLLEMTGSFQKVAALTQESVEVAVDARQTASEGLKAVSNTVEGMQRIRDQVQSTSKRIKRFGESSQEIGEIVQLISDIADRTSILALNASIQAAMAGDAGQGFAVVAEEIECLAERSTDATKQISKLIRAIQNETSEVIADMEESTREVVAGSQLAAQAGETLFEIDSVSNQLVELIQTSSTSALQQVETATRIASSMAEISQSTKDSAEKSREATRSVGRLAGMVNQLRGSVAQFKVSEPSVMVASLPLEVQALVEESPAQTDDVEISATVGSPASAPINPPIAAKAVPMRAAKNRDEKLLRQLREAKGLNERGNKKPVAKPLLTERAKKTGPKTMSLDQSQPQKADSNQSSPATMILDDEKSADSKGKETKESSASEKRNATSQTMVISDPPAKTEDDDASLDQNLLKQLTDASAMLDAAKKSPQKYDPTRTIMLDNE